MDLNWVREIIESEFMNSIFTGLIASIFFALIILIIQRIRYRWCLRCRFNNRTFHTYYKRFSDEIVQEVKCTVKRNILKFKGKNILDGRTFSGEIIFNPINLKIGEGFQAYDNSDAFNFTKVIIKSDNSLLVDASYVAMEDIKSGKKKGSKYGILKPEAFIWRKVD
ncbi:MAG TPA: hypothetical protein VLZ75_04150 [Chitinophagales bacterium]|nr:hypothetical protein [Chitinophagales bacterium]